MTIEKKLSQIRKLSEAAWDGCADNERFQAGLAGEEFDRARDEWEQAWDEAENLLEDGNTEGALEELEKCRGLENAYGSDEHARAAVALFSND
jgi:hypothetical protein